MLYAASSYPDNEMNENRPTRAILASNRSNLTLTAAFVIAGAMGVWGVHGLDAQDKPAPFTRTILQTQDLSTPGRAAVVARVDIQPGAEIGKHTAT